MNKGKVYNEHSSYKEFEMPKIYEDLRKQILKHAKEIIVKNGYRKLNMRDVASKSGIAIGTIYNYFPTKDALVSEVMYGYWMDFILETKRIANTQDDLFTKLRSIYKILEEFIDIFKENWLKLDKNENGMTKEHYKQKNEIIHFFMEIIQEAVKEQRKKSKMDNDINISDEDLAEFIAHNIMMIAQIRELKYDTFERILKQYFQ